ncbi:heparan-alpha-glucosaminide N-acetyltransferase [Marinomonas epiphytica]
MSVSTHKRSQLLDAYRGLAVLLMIAFHLCWDLRNFGFVEYNLYDPFWVNFRRLILLIFITAIGWSAFLATQSTKNLASNKRHWLREGKLLVCAAAISLVTYFAFPDQWIYFGILHFILLASILVKPFCRFPIGASFIGAGVVMLYQHTELLHFPNAFNLISEYLPLPRRTLDIVFPFPWLGVALIGPLLGYLGLHRIALPQHLLSDFLALLGRHALPIYLTHQVFLFTLVAGAKMLLNWLS